MTNKKEIMSNIKEEKNPLNLGMIISLCLFLMLFSLSFLGAVQAKYSVPNVFASGITQSATNFALGIANVFNVFFEIGQTYPNIFYYLYFIIVILVFYNILLNLWRTVKYYNRPKLHD